MILGLKLSNETMKKRLLIITEAGDVYPSGKIRAYIYRDLFHESGYDVTFKTCLIPAIARLYYTNNAFVRALRLIGFIPFLNLLNSTVFKPFNMWLIPRLATSYDVIYLQKVLSWKLVEQLLSNKKARLVYDLNDGLWLPLWHKHTGGKIETILGSVNAITCDNPVGLAFAKSLNTQSYLVPDSPQIELFDARRGKVAKSENEVVIGWIGTPGSLFNLYNIFEALEIVFGKFKNLKLRILGGGTNFELWPPFENVRYTIVPSYSQAELVEEVLKMDIGLFPLFDIENSRARGILKATIYMSGEAAVIGSPIGQSVELIQDGVNGMLALHTNEWVEKLGLLITNSELRKKIAKNGLQTVRENYTINGNYKKLLQVLAP